MKGRKDRREGKMEGRKRYREKGKEKERLKERGKGKEGMGGREGKEDAGALLDYKNNPPLIK